MPPKTGDADMTETEKRPRGRPIEKEWPEPIPDTPENIMRALLATPPKREEEWEYLKRAREG